MRIKRLVLLLMTLALASGAAAKAERLAHYLLLGVDGWGVGYEDTARSDAIVLASLDYARDKIIFTSFARDSLVEPSYRSGVVKLNALVRSSGGEQVLIDYLEETYQLPISGCFTIDFTGTVGVIDAIGGITVELTEDEAAYLKKHAGDYDGFRLKAGRCRINGAQALYYMRCRSLDSDFGRQGRQGNVLRAMLQELQEITPLQMIMLFDDVLGMYQTNLSLAQQIELGYHALKLLDAEVELHTIPEEGTYHYGRDSQGASGLAYDVEESRRQLYGFLGYEQTYETEATAESVTETETEYEEAAETAGE